MVLDILASIVLILHGPYSIYAGFKNKALVAQIFDSDFYFERKFLGASFNKIFNILFGIIELILGVLILLKFK